MKNVLLKCKKCDKVREEIKLEDLNNNPQLKQAIERIYSKGNTILSCSDCGDISIVSPFQMF